MDIIIAIIVFGLIITIHELGHFTVAKLCKIKVNKFAIGMGPILFKKQKGETEYSLRLFPIGGFVSMEGEDEESNDDRAFSKRPILHRMAVVVAGAIMNIILGFILVIIITSASNQIITTKVAGFQEGATSSETGLQVGDKILKVNGMKIFTDSDVAYKLRTDSDGIVSMQVLRDGKKVNLDEVKFKLAKDEKTDKNYLTIDFIVNAEKKNFFNVIDYSFRKTVSVGRLIWLSFADLVTGQYNLNDLSGPVGIIDAIGEAKSYGLDSLLNLVVFITINVGIFNLLPLPALDGGRLIFLIIEAIRRKPVPQEKEAMVHFIGIVLLMILMVIVTFNDIFKKII